MRVSRRVEWRRSGGRPSGVFRILLQQSFRFEIGQAFFQAFDGGGVGAAVFDIFCYAGGDIG